MGRAHAGGRRYAEVRRLPHPWRRVARVEAAVHGGRHTTSLRAAAAASISAAASTASAASTALTVRMTAVLVRPREGHHGLGEVVERALHETLGVLEVVDERVPQRVAGEDARVA